MTTSMFLVCLFVFRIMGFHRVVVIRLRGVRVICDAWYGFPRYSRSFTLRFAFAGVDYRNPDRKKNESLIFGLGSY